MIVDVHTHLWESPGQLGQGTAERLRRDSAAPWDRTDGSVDAFDQAMSPVQHAIILGFKSQHLGASIPLDQVAGYVQRNPSRYFGFAGIDPMAGGYLDEIAEAAQRGLAGVVISPAAQNFHPSHTDAMRLYEDCERRKLPVFIHPGTHFAAAARMEFSLPYLFDEVARSFPELRLVLAQAGHPWVEQALLMLGKHPHVYADISDVVRRPWHLYSALLSAHQQGVTSQLLFGSDFPFCTPEKAIVNIYSINTMTQGTHLPSIPRESLRSVIERDALSCLGITPPDADDPRPARDEMDPGQDADPAPAGKEVRR